MKPPVWMLILVPLLLVGCASPQMFLVHPRSGDIQLCAEKGWGYIGAPEALIAFDNCVKSYESLGYIRADHLSPEQRANLKPAPRPIEADIKIQNR